MGTNRFATLVRFDSRANLVCVQPEVSSDKGRDSAVLEAYLLTVLWQVCRVLYQTTAWLAPALAPAPAPAPTHAPVPAIMKGLVCRRAQRSDPCGPPSHRQYLWGCPSSARRARCFLSIFCHVEAVVGQDSGLQSTQCQIAMVVYQRVDHHSTALLPDNEMQSPLGSC